MNSKGQVWGYTLMLGITVVILALAFAPIGQSFVNDAMNVSTASAIGMDCDNSSISSFTKGACVVTDFSLAYFFGGLIFIGVAIITAKLAFGGSE